MSIENFLIGDTVKLTWVNSGVSVSSSDITMYNSSETIVNTSTLTDSGNGHYYSNITLPDSAGFYVVQTIAYVNGFPYKRRIKLRAVTDEV